jgi:DNA-binding response OmpR family regulator
MAGPSHRNIANGGQPSVAAVVLLEDDPDDAFFVRRALEKAHFGNPIITFATAEQARGYFGESRPSALPALFILDVKLRGGETGIGFLRWLRQQRAPLGSTPAMMLTGSESLADRDESQMLGSIYFLQKPVTEEAITAAVQSLGLIVTSRSGVTERAIERQP